MTAFATQSNIDMSGPGLLGSDVVGSSRRKSKRITIGTGLTLSGGVLSNSLDLSGYVQKTSATGSLILPSGTTAERDGSPAAGYSRWNTTTSRFERWTGGIWENYVRLSGDTMTGALSLGSNGLTCSTVTASGNVRGAAFYESGGATTGWYMFSNGMYGYISGGQQFVLNGSGLTVVGSVNASDTIKIRNGLTAQCQIINKSYTSDASQEALILDAGKQVAGNLGLYSYRGSAGGSNYPIQIGMLAADGTTFSGISVKTDGLLEFFNAAGSPAIGPYSNAGITVYGMSAGIGSIRCKELILNATGYAYWTGRGALTSSANGVVHIQNFDFDESVNQCLALGPATTSTNGVKVKRVVGTTTLNFRNGNDTADAALTCGAITASGIVSVSASTTARASVNLPSGAAPTSPANGDMWSDGSDIKVRLGGVTYTLLKV